MAIVAYDMKRTKIENMATFKSIMEKDPTLTLLIEQVANKVHKISVSETMGRLTHVGDLLTLAYAGCKGHSSGPLTLGLLSNFQSLAYDCVEASNLFVQASIDSVNKHRMALLFLDKSNSSKALQKISETGEIAGKMVEVSDVLIKKSQSLCDDSHTALLKTCEDQNLSEDEKKQVNKMIADYKARQSGLEQKNADLQDAIEITAKKEKELGEAAAKKKTQAFILSFIPFTSTSRDLAKEEGDRLARQESEEAARRREMQKDLRENNSSLRESITRLANTSSHKTELERSIHSLDVSIKTLGKVKTTFEGIKAYWKNVQKHCESLSKFSEIKDANELAELDGDTSDLVDAIKNSGLHWMALGILNDKASNELEGVKSRVNRGMDNLPFSENVNTMITDLSSSMLLKLDDDFRMIENG